MQYREQVLTLLCNWNALKCTQHICQLIQQAADFAGEAAQHGLPIMTRCCLQSHKQTSDFLICQTCVWIADGVAGFAASLACAFQEGELDMFGLSIG